MTIDPFNIGDINTFLGLAELENWVAEQWEFEFLLNRFPQGCFSARDDSGENAGFVTALIHQKSGWIGNLIVAEKFRGNGIGEALFTSSYKMLQEAGAETVWLTASKSGRALYEKHGFSSIDTIVRWVGAGQQRHAGHGRPDGTNGINPRMSGLDWQAWGDRREALLAATVGRGKLLSDDSGFISLQSCRDSVQFGPFSAVDSGSAERLFEAASRTVAVGTKIFIDAPASNRIALQLFNRRRMKITGSNLLMYAGIKPQYRPELIYGLATMGSCG